MHSAVSVAQLGVVMVMSIARAGLRMWWLKPDANSFSEYPDEVIGHDIDWLALRIGEKDIQDSLSLDVYPPVCQLVPYLLIIGIVTSGNSVAHLSQE
jgi:hypothetical protein